MKKKDFEHLIHIFVVGKFMNVLITLRLTQYLRTILKKMIFFSKMTNTLSKEIPLKFTKNNFREMDTPDLLINIWTCNYYKPHCEMCNACKIYCEWYVEILAERWDEEKCGEINIAIEKILKNDEHFININLYSKETKWGIIDELIKKNKMFFFFFDLKK